MSFIIANQKYILATVFVLIFTWENILPQRHFADISKHNLQNFTIGAVNLVITFVCGLYFAKYLDWCGHNLHGVLFFIPGSFSVKVIFSIIIADIIMYWWHRLNHTIPFFWQFHSFHHQDAQMNSTTSVRFHILELVFSFIFRMIWYPIFGSTSLMVIIFSTIHFSMIIFHHSNIKIYPSIDKLIRMVITSPGMHRIHHSNKLEETNSNYTSILSCWDWVFGSYVSKAKGEIKFGLPGVEPRRQGGTGLHGD